MMGVFNSVYVLRPINKTAARGVSSGTLVSEWRAKDSRAASGKWGLARKKRPGKKRRVMQLIDEEMAFLRRARLSRKDETYQLAIAMKMDGMDALRFSMERLNGLWTLLYETKEGAIEPVSKLAAKLNCSIVSAGDKRTIMRKLDKLDGIMYHYECIGWSVE